MGVKRSTFEKMIKILNEADKSKRLETQAVFRIALINSTGVFIREHRTYFHVSQSYGVSDST